MNTTLEITTPARSAFAKRTRGELLRLMYALDTRRSSHGAGKVSKKVPPAKSVKRFSLARQSQLTHDLLRRYFVLQVAQITGNAG